MDWAEFVKNTPEQVRVCKIKRTAEKEQIMKDLIKEAKKASE